MLLNSRAYIFIRTLKKKDISYIVYLRVVFDSVKKDYSLGIKIPDPTKFDSQKNLIKGGAEVLKTNILIQQMLNKANTILHESDLSGEKITALKFESLFKENGINKDSFVTFANAEIEFMRGQITEGYHRQLKSEISKLLKYKKELLFSEISFDFLRQYEKYMVTDLKNNLNTVGKTMKKIKTLIGIAVRKEKMDRSPFADYKIKSEPTNRNFLTIDELNTLNKLFNKKHLPNYLQNVLQYFLFSCYCGLRYTDILQLKYEDIQLNQGEYFLAIEQHKTKDRVYIPMKNRALQLIGEMKGNTGKIFKVNTNQVTNRFLKEIINLAVINKEISFHCARHTFATVALSIGIDIKTISSLLGHTDLKTTQIYAKVLMSSKSTAMDKFNDI
ncbi:MAG: site-specific integrase [Bacteroidota bacterium]